MLFNRDNNGSEEIRMLTGNYYNSNDFDKIRIDLEISASELCMIIGPDILEKAESLYEEYKSDKLIDIVRTPIAIMAAMNMYRKNDLSHEDSGRKVKIDNDTEKIPWEWQLEKDDRIHLEEYYRAVDRLIDYLERTKEELWIKSEQRKLSQDLFIRNAKEFDRLFPINGSGRMYMLLTPFIREAERRYIKPALGIDEYTRLKSDNDLSDQDKSLMEYIKAPIPLLTMSIAIRRMPLSVIPFGVIQRCISQSQTMNGSETPSTDMIREVSDWLMDDALVLIEEMKREKNGAVERQLLPKNNIKNKYMMIN